MGSQWGQAARRADLAKISKPLPANRNAYWANRAMQGFLNQLLNRHPENINAHVEIYTWQTCPYCIRAKLLLWWKGVKFTEYKIDGDGGARLRMAERANGSKKVPQIFINDQHIGGCDELYTLDTAGKLDPLLSEPA